MQSFWKKFVGSSEGSGALEFAIVAAPFFSLLLVIFEVGISSVRQYVLDETGVKLARCGSLIGLDTDREKIKEEQICPANLPFLECEQISLGAANLSGGGVVQNDQIISGWSVGLADDVIMVELSYPYEPLIPLVKIVPTIDKGGELFIYSRNIIRNEPNLFSRSGGPC